MKIVPEKEIFKKCRGREGKTKGTFDTDVLLRYFCEGTGVVTPKNKPLRRGESLFGIPMERRARQMNHFEFASFSGLQLKGKDISKHLHKDGIAEMLLIESKTLTPRDIFFMIFMTGMKASGISFRKGIIF